MTGEPESLETTEPLAARRARHDFDRLIMLSDGVFAIAITLLAFDIRPPDSWNGQLGSMWAALAPLLSAYSLSFLVISVYWLLHRRFLGVILRVDMMATALNLLVLGLVALLPAGTRVAGVSEGKLSALGLYAALVIAIGFALALFWGYVALVGDLVSPQIGARARWTPFLAMLIAPPLALFLTIGTHVPSGIVPLVLIAMFVAGGLVFNRLTREPRRKANAAGDVAAADD
jgi:uncharacterized membrane protein